jgi:hypothetical protein
MDDLEKAAAFGASVDGLGERKRNVTPEEASELGVVLHGGRGV